MVLVPSIQQLPLHKFLQGCLQGLLHSRLQVEEGLPALADMRAFLPRPQGAHYTGTASPPPRKATAYLADDLLQEFAREMSPHQVLLRRLLEASLQLI